MKIKIFTLMILVSFSMYAQGNKTCNTPKEEALEDLNSITKCSIESSKKSNNKKSRQIKVRVSANKKRYLKRRTSVAKKSAVAGVSGTTSGIKNTSKTRLAKSLVIKNTLSEAEVKKAKTFMTVDEIPTFKKCKAKKGDDRLDCFNQEMVNHINNTFEYPGEAVRDNIQGDVWVRFIIDNEGRVANIKTLGPDGGEILVKEAKRVVAELPFFEPATLKGKKVSVKYGFPINFSLDNND